MVGNFKSQIIKIKDKELYNLIVNRPGGRTSMRIIDEILIKPKNENQIAKILHLDYKTVTYHLDIIHRHNFIDKEKFNKYTFYFPSDRLIKNIEEYNSLKEMVENER